ncbi:unnamed protein product, partial [Symbiodinium sp. CCMP2456]
DRCRAWDTARRLRCLHCGEELAELGRPLQTEDAAKRCRCLSCGAALSEQLLWEKEQTAVRSWRQLESHLGESSSKLLSPSIFIRTFAQEGRQRWTETWRRLQVWRKQHEPVLSPRHWAMAHAKLLSAELSLVRLDGGFPLPISAASVVAGAANFVDVSIELCPEASWLTKEIQADVRQWLPKLYQEMNFEIEPAAIAEALASLAHDVPLRIQLDEMD